MASDVSYITNDDDATYCVEQVTDYDAILPEIKITIYEGIKIFNEEERKEWYDSYLDPEYNRFCNIDGIAIHTDEFDCNPIMCDYCDRPLKGTFRRCTQDEMNLCQKCFETHDIGECYIMTTDEGSSESLIKYAKKRNREESLDHKRRKDLLEKCIMNHQDSYTVKTNNMICRLCGVSVYVKHGVWRHYNFHCEEEDNVVEYGVCEECFDFVKDYSVLQSTDCASFVCDEDLGGATWTTRTNNPFNADGLCDKCKTHVLEKEERKEDITKAYTFGSLFEWLPLFKDQSGHVLLYNTSQSSVRYHKVAIMTQDDHGRGGFHTIELSLDDALVEFEKHSEAYEERKRNGKRMDWKMHYLSPLCKMVTDRGKQVNLG